MPTLALWFLSVDFRSLFEFAHASETKPRLATDGADLPDDTWVLAYTESPPATFFGGAGNSPARGRFWIEPETGRILLSELAFVQGLWDAVITVRYDTDNRLGHLVPAVMRERYDNKPAGSRIEGEGDVRTIPPVRSVGRLAHHLRFLTHTKFRRVGRFLALVVPLLAFPFPPPAAAGSDSERPRHPVRRATSDITVDGHVVETAWADALAVRDLQIEEARAVVDRGPSARALARGQKSWDAGLSGTKRDYPGQTPGVCCGFGEAPRPDGDQDFCPAVFPHSAILEEVGDGFDPWKSVFEGPCGSHHQHNPGHDPGPDSTVIELVALLRAQPFSKQRGRRGIRGLYPSFPTNELRS